MRAWAVLLASAALVAAACPAAAQTVILARHAEKADSGADPVLSAAGEARAAALAETLAGAGVTHVLVTPTQRTTLTAAPTAEAAGIESITVSFDGGLAAHLARTVDAIRGYGPDAVVLVIGHSNTVPALARTLGDADEPDMDDCTFDRLIVLDLNRTPTGVERRRYGTPSTGC